MSKTMILILSAILVSMFIHVSAYSQEDMVEIDNSVFDNPQRTPALFKHDEHNENAGIEECNGCHHVHEKGKKVEDESSEDQRCSDCHAVKASRDNPLPLMRAFHTNCKSCHMEKKKGPVMCGECHKKTRP